MPNMRAAMLYGKEDVRLEEVPVPEPASCELVVRVRAALTCGTDIKVFRRGYHAKMLELPALFGHEVAGDIAAAGSGVDPFQVGDRVVAANSAPCDQCFFCRRGQANLCDDLLFNNGAYAEFIRIPERIVRKNTYLIPANMSYQDAALTEPLACALRALDETHPKPGDVVAVMGLGPLGLMLVRLAKLAFHCRVMAIARRVEQLDQAMLFGAETGILLGENAEAFLAEARAETGGYGADVVIEAIGQPYTWELATRLVRKGGTVNFFGGCPAGTTVSLDTTLLHYSEITCKATFHHTPAYVRRALQLISEEVVTANHLVTATEPLDALPQVLSDLAHRRSTHIKTAIIP